MSKLKLLPVILFLFIPTYSLMAQDGYLVRTNEAGKVSTGSDERIFTANNFPYCSICDFPEGAHFLFVIEEKYNFISTLKSLETGKEVNNGELHHKMLTFKGTEEVSKESYTGTRINTRFLFECEKQTFFYEVKDKHLNEICSGDPRASINNLVYLKDVDTARKLLIGKTLYLNTTTVRIDSPNGNESSIEMKLPLNIEVTVTAIGAGSRECPVKIVFEDASGNSYFREVAFSLTNSGMVPSDITGRNRGKMFENAFTFVNKEAKAEEAVKNEYIGRIAYPKVTIQVTKENGEQTLLPRYTSIVIRDLKKTDSRAILLVEDKNGVRYNINADLKYDVIIRNEDFIDDILGYGDLNKLYPTIGQETWQSISEGKVKKGMTMQECILTIGEPINRVKGLKSEKETWFYHGLTIDFDGNIVIRIL